MAESVPFDPDCSACPRLVGFLQELKLQYSDYHCAPVAPFGDKDARLLIVGLAPGMHGANASGRPFTGDHAGILLYQTLYDSGLSSAAESRHARDDLKLMNCRITNAVKCLPPQNKPLGSEVKACNVFLTRELEMLPPDSVVLALGGVAHRAVVGALGLRQVDFAFAHGAEHRLNDELILLDSYHCSRYNTQTRRLTPRMFQQVFHRARELLEAGDSVSS
jgi:uracil-DNA glycosylase family 4